MKKNIIMLVVLVLMLSLLLSIGAFATATENEDDRPPSPPYAPDQIIVGIKDEAVELLNKVKLIKTNPELCADLFSEVNVVAVKDLTYGSGKCITITIKLEENQSLLAAIELLQQNPDIEYAHPNYIVVAVDPGRGGGGGGGGGETPQKINATLTQIAYFSGLGPPATVKFFSVAELDAYVGEHYNNRTPLFLDRDKYDETFFKDNFLVYYHTVENSAANVLELISITEGADSVEVVLTRTRFGVITVIGAYALVLEADKSLADKTFVINDTNIYRGDVNRDGKITASDATEILLYTTGAKPLTAQQLDLADVNKDGRVSAADAMEILLIAAGLKESY